MTTTLHVSVLKEGEECQLTERHGHTLWTPLVIGSKDQEAAFEIHSALAACTDKTLAAKWNRAWVVTHFESPDQAANRYPRNRG